MKRKIFKLLILPLCLVMSFGLYGQEDDYFTQVQNSESYTAAELAELDANFSTFVSLMELSGLDSQMEYTEEFTMFIPTDEAFGEMDKEEFDKLKNPDNRAELQDFLRRHIIPEKVYLLEFEGDQVIETSDGKMVEVDADRDLKLVYIGGAEIIASDFETSDGIVHVVDAIVRETDEIID